MRQVRPKVGETEFGELHLEVEEKKKSHFYASHGVTSGMVLPNPATPPPPPIDSPPPPQLSLLRRRRREGRRRREWGYSQNKIEEPLTAARNWPLKVCRMIHRWHKPSTPYPSKWQVAGISGKWMESGRKVGVFLLPKIKFNWKVAKLKVSKCE